MCFGLLPETAAGLFILVIDSSRQMRE